MLIITQFSDIGSHHGHDISTPEGVGIVDDRSQLITRFFGLHSGKGELKLIFKCNKMTFGQWF